jgi:predicted extracellular nuclease
MGGGTIPAPTITSTTPANGATGVSELTTIQVEFSQTMPSLPTSAFSLDCPTGTPQLFSVVTSGSTATITPSSPLPTTTVCTVTAYAAEIGNANGNLAADYPFSFTTAAPPTITRLHDIPRGASGGSYTVEGVVIASYQVGGLDGFYIQEPDARVDNDPTTSEGIFVWCNACPVSVSEGDYVRVTGNRSLYQHQTQISATSAGSVSVIDTGHPLPSPEVITLPVPSTMDIMDFYRQYEGMLVTVSNTMTVTEMFQLGRFGELKLIQGGRPTQYTQINAPSVTGYNAYLDELARRTLILDDGLNTQNPDPIIYPQPGGLSASNTVRGGDTITNLTGVLTYTWSGNSASPNAWRIRPVESLLNTYTFTSANPRPVTPPNVGGRFQVASYNVLNYFTTTGAGYTCGPAGTTQCRGADNATELARQQAKIVNTICTLDAAVVGLIELENPRSTDALDIPMQTLVAALNGTASPCGTYDYLLTGTIGGDAIKNGFIYQPSVVTPIGPAWILDDEDPFDRNTRPPLAQVFEENATGERFIVVVNHFKSKGCTGATGANADQGDGQSCWNPDRTVAAGIMADWLDEIQTTTGVNRVLIIGDLNSYGNEDPLTLLESRGYTNLATQTNPNAYGYVFDGQWGTLDYALANPGLLADVVNTAEWHINADEPSVLDYNTNFKTTGQIASFYDSSPFRSSDHDPVLVGLSLGLHAPTVDFVEGDSGISISAGATVSEALSEVSITFTTPVFNTTNTADPNYNDSASNPANYLLLAEGAVSGFQTVSCVAGVSADDDLIPQFSTVHDDLTNTTTLTFDPALGEGVYRLIICGTTSIVSAANPAFHLNDGNDTVIHFTIDLSATPTTPTTPTTPDTFQPLQPEEMGVGQLPSTGETPMWRDMLMRVLVMGGLALVMMAAGWVFRRRDIA